MSDQSKSRLMHPINVIWGTQFLTLALVLHMWFDMMGKFERGGKLAGLLIVGAFLIYLAPAISIAYDRIRGEFA